MNDQETKIPAVYFTDGGGGAKRQYAVRVDHADGRWLAFTTKTRGRYPDPTFHPKLDQKLPWLRAPKPEAETMRAQATAFITKREATEEKPLGILGELQGSKTENEGPKAVAKLKGARTRLLKIKGSSAGPINAAHPGTAWFDYWHPKDGSHYQVADDAGMGITIQNIHSQEFDPGVMRDLVTAMKKVGFKAEFARPRYIKTQYEAVEEAVVEPERDPLDADIDEWTESLNESYDLDDLRRDMQAILKAAGKGHYAVAVKAAQKAQRGSRGDQRYMDPVLSNLVTWADDAAYDDTGRYDRALRKGAAKVIAALDAGYPSEAGAKVLEATDEDAAEIEELFGMGGKKIPVDGSISRHGPEAKSLVKALGKVSKFVAGAELCVTPIGLKAFAPGNVIQQGEDLLIPFAVHLAYEGQPDRPAFIHWVETQLAPRVVQAMKPRVATKQAMVTLARSYVEFTINVQAEPDPLRAGNLQPVTASVHHAMPGIPQGSFEQVATGGLDDVGAIIESAEKIIDS